MTASYSARTGEISIASFSGNGSAAAAVPRKASAATSSLGSAHPRLDIEAPFERQLLRLHRDVEPAKTAADLGWNFDDVDAACAGQQVPARRVGNDALSRARDERCDPEVAVAGIADRDAQLAVARREGFDRAARLCRHSRWQEDWQREADREVEARGGRAHGRVRAGGQLVEIETIGPLGGAGRRLEADAHQPFLARRHG